MSIIDGTINSDTLFGTTGADILYGYDGNDSITAGAGNDYIDAGAGDDTIVGGQGSNGLMQTPANGIVGGDGYDTVTYAGNVADYRITLTAGTGYLTVVNLITGSRDIMTGVETLHFADTSVVLVQPNAAPTVSGPLLANLDENSLASFSALANATDANGDALSVVNLAALPAGVSFDAATNTFTVDASGFDSLAAGETATLTLTYDITDGQANVATQASFTVIGLNDTAQFTGQSTGTMTEDASLITTGQLTVTDADHDQSAFVTTPVAGTYGALTIDATGAWSYALNNSLTAVQILNSGQSLTDTITVNSLDGSQTQIAITINGANEPLVGIIGTAGADVLNGTAGNDNLYGLAGNDKLNGHGGADLLDGGLGADSLLGGAGNDRVIYDATDRVVDGGTGTDALLISTSVTANLGASDQVAGGSSIVTGFENIDASAALTAVTLTGSSNENALTGGAASDILTGKGGADWLTGDTGADHFIFTATTDSTTMAADTITDVTAGQDVIDLSAIDAIRGATNNAFTFIGGSAFTAAGQMRYDATTGALEADTNGDHIADLHINLVNTPMLQTTDFIV